MMFVGFVVSTSISTFILELTFYHRDDFKFLDSFLDHARWGIMPALISGFVAYRMDAPASDAETLSQTTIAAALRFLAWGGIAVIFMLYATDDLALEKLNLRFTLVGTAFLVTGLLGAAARFKTAND